MLVVSPRDRSVRAGNSPSGLREILKQSTAAAHRDLDKRFAVYDLTSVQGYRRFLEASAAALLRLEAELERGGITDLVSDWPMRRRSAAITADLDGLGGTAQPLPPMTLMKRNEMLGAMYVLEGSRLGAKYLLRAVADCDEPMIATATRYLRHGSGQPLWQSFLVRLESEPVTSAGVAEMVCGAQLAFAMFAEAAGA